MCSKRDAFTAALIDGNMTTLRVRFHCNLGSSPGATSHYFSHPAAVASIKGKIDVSIPIVIEHPAGCVTRVKCITGANQILPALVISVGRFGDDKPDCAGGRRAEDVRCILYEYRRIALYSPPCRTIRRGVLGV